MRTLLLTASLLLVAPGAAAAATPGDYGGGGFTAKGKDAVWLWVRVADDGSARTVGSVQTRCGVGMFNANLALAPDGTFRFSSSFVSRGFGHPVRARVKGVGRIDGALATGTIRAHVRGRKPERCSTRRPRSFTLHLQPAAGTPGPPEPGGFVGITSGARPIVLWVAADATRVGRVIFDYKADCDNGEWNLTNFTPGGRIRPGGTFALRERFAFRFKGGVVERFRIRVDGQFTAGGVSGTLRMRSVARRAGRVVDRCDTGAVTFSALHL